LSFVNLFKMPYKALVFVKNKICKKSFQSLFMYLSYYMLRAGIGTGCG
jgi:hypothetical protein